MIEKDTRQLTHQLSHSGHCDDSYEPIPILRLRRSSPIADQTWTNGSLSWACSSSMTHKELYISSLMTNIYNGQGTKERPHTQLSVQRSSARGSGEVFTTPCH